MSDAGDPHCPECGEPIGQTATYCMHCSADLTEEREAADADEDGAWDRTGTPAGTQDPAGSEGAPAGGGRPDAGIGAAVADAVGGSPDAGAASGRLLAPDGLVDDTLTVLVGIVGGLVVGAVGTVVLVVLTGSGWAVLVGFAAWLAATAYLVRRRTVQEAVAKSAYGVALVFLSVPVVALSPAAVDGGVGQRGGLFVVLFAFVAVPAAIAAAIGWAASRFVPEGAGGSEG